ncbi:unnamed protein product, partial [Heligmosomoides polygyrus]|uniref:Transmembrane protein n=1 Tax=Heligmosomoides polygyrus TaxID=6339 RepID=A0A183FNY5_HELPZ
SESFVDYGIGLIYKYPLELKKLSILPYQNHVRILELLIILAFAPIEALRLSWGIRGNLTETPAFLAFSSLLSVPVLLIIVYLAIFQNYVLLIESIIVGLGGVLTIVETIAGLALFATLSTSVPFPSPLIKNHFRILCT